MTAAVEDPGGTVPGHARMATVCLHTPIDIHHR